MTTDDRQRPARVRVAIIGAGFSGLGLAIRLREAGADDFVVLERAGELGGTWRDNSYPGATCDVPSHLYSFSFALNPRWSSSFSGQPEIWEYLRECAAGAGVLDRFRFGHEVLGARWDERERAWEISTTGGEFRTRVLIAATGALSEPSVPAIAGLEEFEGAAFHSARWDHSVELAGKRVAVIGTGASAIQFVPEIQPAAGRVTVFQRTPPWVMPRSQRAISDLERALFSRVPGAQRLARWAIYLQRELLVPGFMRPRLARPAQRIARAHLARQVADPGLRALLTPRYAFGCKRILISNDWYPALCQPNVSVVTEPITEITPGGVRTADGVEHAADVIVFGTGFRVTDPPIAGRLRGASGQTLAEAWADGMEAYLGTTVAGFPNLFLMTGPNTGLGHTSMILMIESQIGYILGALRAMSELEAAAVSVRPERQAAFSAGVQRRLAGTVWNSGGCRSWYLDERGRNSTIWPGSPGRSGARPGGSGLVTMSSTLGRRAELEFELELELAVALASCQVAGWAGRRPVTGSRLVRQYGRPRGSAMAIQPGNSARILAPDSACRRASASASEHAKSMCPVTGSPGSASSRRWSSRRTPIPGGRSR